MVERPPATDDDDTRPVLSHTAELTIGVVVFALGILAGAAIAAWVRPRTGPEHSHGAALSRR
jgi:hypothetical protein